MKRLLIALSLGLALTASAQTSRYYALDFINGDNMVVSNNFTVTYPGIGTYFVPPGLATNMQAGVVNPINTNVYVAPLLSDAESKGDVLGDVQANAAISVTYGDPNLWLKLNQPGYFTNGYTSLVATNISSTNYTTYTFQRSTDGVRFGTTAQDKFVFSIQSSPTGGTVTTNVPSGFLVGARKVRLLSAGASSSTSSVGVIVDKITLSYFGP